jgi:AcrR family transcriptional regulator
MFQADIMRSNKTPPATTRDETRRNLIQAAGEIFGQVGYEAATVREISGRAGANVAAVNYHFRDKLGLYTETLKTAVDATFVLAMNARLALLPPDEALRLFLVEMFRQIHNPEHPAWYTKVMVHELAQPTAGLVVVVEQVIQPNSQTLCELVNRITGLPALDPRTRLFAHSIMGQVVHYMHSRPVLRLLWPEWDLTHNAMDEIAEHITRFSLEGMKGMMRANARSMKTVGIAEPSLKVRAPALPKSNKFTQEP